MKRRQYKTKSYIIIFKGGIFMAEFAETLNGYVSIVNGWVWGPVMLTITYF